MANPPVVNAASGSSPPMERVKDPMKFPLILEIIFLFCDVPSLKNVRLVSREWRNCSLKSWRAKAVIQLSQEYRFVQPKAKLKFRDFVNMHESKYDSLQLQKYPFKRYSIDLDHGEAQPATDVIRDSCPQYVSIHWESEYFDGLDECLSELNSDELKTLEVLWYTLEQDIPGAVVPVNFPNIKRLKLFTTFLESDFLEHARERSLWDYLLRSFSKLEALSVGYKIEEEYEHKRYPICVDDRLAIANLLKSLRQTGGEEVMPLKELEMMDVYINQNIYGSESKEYDIIKALAACNFPLENLSIHVGQHGDENETLPIFPLLNSCKDTLQKLKASINFNREFYGGPNTGLEDNGRTTLKPHFTFTSDEISMEVLKEVRLLNRIEWAMFFLRHFQLPQLETLVVEYDKSRNSYHDRRGPVRVLFPTWIIYEGLHSFELLDNLNIPDQQMIETFAKMMPNLLDLKIPVDKRTFPMICKNFKNLKTLHILSGQGDYIEIDDEALTGLSKAQLKKGGVLSTTRRRANITDLKHLSDLKICCQRQLQRNDMKFTKHSVVHGFLQLPQLYRLSIAFKKMSMSTQMKGKLLDHVKGGVHFQRLQKPPNGSFSVEIAFEDESSSMEEEANE